MSNNLKSFNTRLWGKWIVRLLDRKDKEWKYIKRLEKKELK